MIFDETVFPTRVQSLFTVPINSTASSGRLSPLIFLLLFLYHPHPILLNLLILPQFFRPNSYPVTLISQNLQVPDSPTIDNSTSSLLQATFSLPIALDPEPPNSPPIASPYHVVTPSRTNNLKPCEFPDFQMIYSTPHPLRALHAGAMIPKPHSYAQAVSMPKWYAAMESKFQALLQNETWDIGL